MIATTARQSSVSLGVELFADLIASTPDIDAVFCGNDNLALGCLFECQRRGIRVPDDIAIIGFNDLEFCASTFPSLTSVATPRYEMARRAAGDRARDHPRLGRASARARIDVGFRIVERASTAPRGGFAASGTQPAAALAAAAAGPLPEAFPARAWFGPRLDIGSALPAGGVLGLQIPPAPIFRRRRRGGIDLRRRPPALRPPVGGDRGGQGARERSRRERFSTAPAAASRSPTRASSSSAMPDASSTTVADARRSFVEAAVPAGELQLGASSLVAGYILADLLARFRRAFPAVEVTAVEDIGEYLEHLLVNGELDVAVMVVSQLRAHAALEARNPRGVRLSPVAAARPPAGRERGRQPRRSCQREAHRSRRRRDPGDRRGLLARSRAAAADRLPHPLGRGGPQPGRHRRRRRRAA